MQKLIAILQIKSRNFKDFKLWLDWYLKFLQCDKVIILDDDSLFDLTKLFFLYDNNKIIYLKMNELNLSRYNDIRQVSNLKYIFDNNYIQKNDIVFTPDDDEFWWYDKNNYNSFKTCIMHKMDILNTDCISVPWILMNNNVPLITRDKDLITTFLYRNTLEFVEHKSILKFNRQIDSNLHNLYKTNKSTTMIDKKYNYQSKTNYKDDIRCYHFRFTTIEEFKQKRLSTISSKTPRAYFNDCFEKQIINGVNQNDNYNILDLTLYNELKNLHYV